MAARAVPVAPAAPPSVNCTSPAFDASDPPETQWEHWIDDNQGDFNVFGLETDDDDGVFLAVDAQMGSWQSGGRLATIDGAYGTLLAQIGATTGENKVARDIEWER